jgi:hypothetical protein
VVAAPTSTPYLPEWCFCTSTIVISPAAEAPVRVLLYRPSPGKGRGWPGPLADGSNVTLSDLDANRVRVRAWRARPCRSGEAEGHCGTGRAVHREVT